MTDPVPATKPRMQESVDGPSPIVTVDPQQAANLIAAIENIDTDSKDYTAVLGNIQTAVMSTATAVGTSSIGSSVLNYLSATSNTNAQMASAIGISGGETVLANQVTVISSIKNTVTGNTMYDNTLATKQAVVGGSTAATIQDSLAALSTATVSTNTTTPPATLQDSLAAIVTALSALPTLTQLTTLVNNWSYCLANQLSGGNRIGVNRGGCYTVVNGSDVTTAITGDYNTLDFNATSGAVGSANSVGVALRAANGYLSAISTYSNAIAANSDEIAGDADTLVTQTLQIADISSAASDILAINTTTGTNVTNIAVSAGATATNTGATATSTNQVVNALTGTDQFGHAITVGNTLQTDTLGNHFVITHDI